MSHREILTITMLLVLLGLLLLLLLLLMTTIWIASDWIVDFVVVAVEYEHDIDAWHARMKQQMMMMMMMMLVLLLWHDVEIPTIPLP
jgi:hypothetical protein